MLFTVISIDKPNALELRMKTRESHLEYARRTNVVKFGGPFLDAQGNMAGSLIFIEVQDIDAAKQWAANDPYAKAGLFERTEVRPWKLTFNPIGISL